MTTFDAFYKQAKEKFPEASLDQVRNVYTRITGNEAILQQGPTRKQFGEVARSRFPEADKDVVDSVYDRIYGGGGLGSEAWRSVKRGGVGLAETLVAGGEWLGDSLGLASDIGKVRQGLGDIRESIPRSAASQGDVYEDPVSTLTNPSWWAAGAPEMLMFQLPVLAGAAVGGPIGAGLVGAGMEGASTYGQAKDMGLENPGLRGTGMGLAAGVLNAIPFIGPAARGALPFAGRIAAEAGTEAAEEIPGAFLESPVDTWGTGTLQEGVRRAANVAPLAALGGTLNAYGMQRAPDIEGQQAELQRLREEQAQGVLQAAPEVSDEELSNVRSQLADIEAKQAEREAARGLVALGGKAPDLLVEEQKQREKAEQEQAAVETATAMGIPAPEVKPYVPPEVEEQQKAQELQTKLATARKPYIEMKKAAVTTIVEPIVSKWKGGPKISVVGTHAELPEAVRQMFPETGGEDALYHRDSGTVFMISDRFKSADGIKTALFHDSLGHFGIEQIMPDAPAFAADVERIAPTDKVLGPIWKEVQTEYADQDAMTRNLEVVARYSEKYPNRKHPLIERIYASLRSFARSLGLDIKMNRADLNRMLRQAMKGMEQGGAASRTPAGLTGTVAHRPVRTPEGAPYMGSPAAAAVKRPWLEQSLHMLEQAGEHTEEERSLLINMLETDKDAYLTQQRRNTPTGTQTLDSTVAKAKELLTGVAGQRFYDELKKARPGTAYNAEQITAIASVFEAHKATEKQARMKASVNASPENLLAHTVAVANLRWVSEKLLGGGTEAGRTLHAWKKAASMVGNINELLELVEQNPGDTLKLVQKLNEAEARDATPEIREADSKIVETNSAIAVLTEDLQVTTKERQDTNTEIGRLEREIAALEGQASVAAPTAAIVGKAEQEARDAQAEVDRITKEIERIQSKPTESRDMDALKKLLADTRAAFRKQDPRKYSNLAERTRSAEAALQSYIDKYGDQRGMLKDAQKNLVAVKREVTKSKDTYSFAQVSEAIRGYEAALQGYIDTYGEQSKLLDEARENRDEARKEARALKSRLDTAVNRTNLANQRAVELKAQAADWASRGGDQQLQDANAQISAANAELRKLREKNKRLEYKERKLEGLLTEQEKLKEELAARRRTMKGKGEVEKVLDEWKPTAMDKVLELFYSNILSGTATHLANMIGNSAFMTLEEGVKQVVLRLSGNNAAANARISAMWLGATTGMRNAKEAFKSELPILDQQTKMDSMQSHKAIGGWLGRTIRVPGRLLQAEDEFFKGIAYAMELAELATIEANGDTVLARKIMDEASPEMKKTALEHARRLTFTSKLGKRMGTLQRLINESKGAKLIIPFVQTPTNIFYRAMDWSPLGLMGVMGNTKIGNDLKGRNGKQAQMEAFTRQTMAGVILMLGWQMAAEGLLSGSPDPDREKQAQEELAGIRGPAKSWRASPTSEWHSYARFDPLAIPLAIIADLYNGIMVAKTTEISDIGTLVMASFMSNMSDKTWLNGLSTAIEAFNQPEQSMEYFISNIASGLMPTSAMAQTMAANDPYLRKTDGILERLQSRLPGYRQQQARKVGLSGEFAENRAATVGGIAVPWQTAGSRDPNDPATRIARAMSEADLVKGLPDKDITYKGVTVEFNSKEYEEWTQLVQRERFRRLLPVINSPQFSRWPQEYRKEILEKYWNSVTNTSNEAQVRKAAFIMRHPRLVTEYTKVKQAG